MLSACVTPSKTPETVLNVLVGDSVYEGLDMHDAPVVQNAKIEVFVENPLNLRGYRLLILKLHEKDELPEAFFQKGNRLSFGVETRLIRRDGGLPETLLKNVQIIGKP